MALLAGGARAVRSECIRERAPGVHREAADGGRSPVLSAAAFFSARDTATEAVDGHHDTLGGGGDEPGLGASAFRARAQR